MVTRFIIKSKTHVDRTLKNDNDELETGAYNGLLVLEITIQSDESIHSEGPIMSLNYFHNFTQTENVRFLSLFQISKF